MPYYIWYNIPSHSGLFKTIPGMCELSCSCGYKTFTMYHLYSSHAVLPRKPLTLPPLGVETPPWPSAASLPPVARDEPHYGHSGGCTSWQGAWSLPATPPSHSPCSLCYRKTASLPYSLMRMLMPPLWVG